ncbi:MAG: lysophospholipid acyltransferase family protein [Flaviflexus sp.]|nr:lysophospholipid acyltransferase family protein [Flaviflexus sp.]
MSPSSRTEPPLITALAPLFRGLSHLAFRLDVRGAENLRTPAIIIANHICHLDALILPTVLYEAGIIPRFAVKKELFRGPVDRLLRQAGQIRVDRDHPVGVIEQLGAVLDEGHSLTVFPEGTFTREPNGWPMRLKTGFARVARTHPDVPIIPVAMWGAHRVLDVPNHTIHLGAALRRPRICVEVGEPLRASGSPREVTQAGHEALTELVARLRLRMGEQVTPPAEAWFGENWPRGRWRLTR